MIEEKERVAQRRAEQWLREVNWETTQVERLAAEAASARDLAERTAKEMGELEKAVGSPKKADAAAKANAERISQLRTRREDLARQRTAEDARNTTWLDERRIAELRRSIDESRLAELDAEQGRLTPRQAELALESEQTASKLGSAELSEGQAAAELNAVLADGADDRKRLIEAERSAADARERLRVAEQQTRKSEVAQMEARLQLEQVREQLVVELAGIGADGLVALKQAAGLPIGTEEPRPSVEAPAEGEDDGAATDAHEETLALVIESWRSTDSTNGPTRPRHRAQIASAHCAAVSTTSAPATHSRPRSMPS